MGFTYNLRLMETCANMRDQIYIDTLNKGSRAAVETGLKNIYVLEYYRRHPEAITRRSRTLKKGMTAPKRPTKAQSIIRIL